MEAKRTRPDNSDPLYPSQIDVDNLTKELALSPARKLKDISAIQDQLITLAIEEVGSQVRMNLVMESHEFPSGNFADVWNLAHKIVGKILIRKINDYHWPEEIMDYMNLGHNRWIKIVDELVADVQEEAAKEM